MGEDVIYLSATYTCPKALPGSSGTCQGIAPFTAGAFYSCSLSQVGPLCLLRMTETLHRLLGRQVESQLCCVGLGTPVPHSCGPRSEGAPGLLMWQGTPSFVGPISGSPCELSCSESFCTRSAVGECVSHGMS